MIDTATQTTNPNLRDSLREKLQDDILSKEEVLALLGEASQEVKRAFKEQFGDVGSLLGRSIRNYGVMQRGNAENALKRQLNKPVELFKRFASNEKVRKTAGIGLFTATSPYLAAYGVASLNKQWYTADARREHEGMGAQVGFIITQIQNLEFRIASEKDSSKKAKLEAELQAKNSELSAVQAAFDKSQTRYQSSAMRVPTGFGPAQKIMGVVSDLNTPRKNVSTGSDQSARSQSEPTVTVKPVVYPTPLLSSGSTPVAGLLPAGDTSEVKPDENLADVGSVDAAIIEPKLVVSEESTDDILPFSESGTSGVTPDESVERKEQVVEETDEVSQPIIDLPITPEAEPAYPTIDNKDFVKVFTEVVAIESRLKINPSSGYAMSIEGEDFGSLKSDINKLTLKKELTEDRSFLEGQFPNIQNEPLNYAQNGLAFSLNVCLSEALSIANIANPLQLPLAKLLTTLLSEDANYLNSLIERICERLESVTEKGFGWDSNSRENNKKAVGRFIYDIINTVEYNLG